MAMNKGNEKTMTWAGILIGGYLVFEIVGGFKGLMEKLGLKADQNTKDLNTASTNSNSWWSPVFYKDKTNARILSRAATEEKAKAIYNAFGLFNDGEEQVIGVFKTLPSQAAASWLSDVFYQLYGEDLLAFLRGGNWPQDRLSDEDVAVINNYINSLPVK